MNALARAWSCFSWAIATFLAFLVVPAASWAHDDPSKTTSLELSLDDSVYVQGQAILALVCLRNTGTDTLQDVGSMEPEDGRLAFRLRNRDSGEFLRKYGTLRTMAYAEEGLSVAPGGSKCEVVNLLNHYGAWPPKEEFLTRALAEFSLPAGNYEVSCVLSVRTGMNRRLGSLVVNSSTRSFRVNARSRAGPGERLLDSLRGEATWTTKRIDRQDREQCRLRLSEAVGTPYVYQVFQCAVPILQGSEMDSVLAEMGEAGVSPVRSGAVLWLACKWHRIPMVGGVAWLQARRAAARSEVERDILETWERRLVQKRDY